MAFCIGDRILCLALPIHIPVVVEKPSPRWVELPLELWGEIGKRLSSRLDLVRFRSVCKQLRSSLPPPTRFPFLVPRPPGAHPRYKLFDSLPYFITESNIYSIEIGSKSKKMLEKVVVEFKGLDQPTKFEARPYFPYFPVGSSDLWFDIPTATSLDPEHQLSRLSFITKAYQLCLAHPRVTPLDERIEGKWDFFDAANFDVKKMVLVSSSNAADGVNANYAPLSNLSAFALLRNEPRLALLRLAGSQDPNWNWDTDFCSEVDFEDIVTYEGQLCTLASCGRVHLMDSNSLKMTEIAGPLPYQTCVWHWMRLFPYHGELYLVVEASLQEIGFDFRRVLVFTLDFQLHQWLDVGHYKCNPVFLSRSSLSISIPRAVSASMYKISLRKCKMRPDDRISSISCGVIMSDGANCHCCVQFSQFPPSRGFPWLLRPEDASTTTTTTTPSSTILSQLDKTEVGRTNYIELLCSPTSTAGMVHQ